MEPATVGGDSMNEFRPLLLIYNKVIAVDFDGTLFAKGGYPAFGAPNSGLIHALRYLKEKNGCQLILWTCREGELLDAAIRACRNVDLEFDAINECVQARREKYGNSRKVGADIYIDDKCLNLSNSSFLPYHLQPGIWRDALNREVKTWTERH